MCLLSSPPSPQHRRTPVLGDDVYGNKDWNRRLQQSKRIVRPLLHAHTIEFTHPSTGQPISLVAPLPPDTEEVVRKIYPQVFQREINYHRLCVICCITRRAWQAFACIHKRAHMWEYHVVKDAAALWERMRRSVNAQRRGFLSANRSRFRGNASRTYE